jgi:mannose-6-phosphate isomerase
MLCHPLIFEPIVKPKLWGGRNLHTLFGKDLGTDRPVGETWEVSDLPGNVGLCAAGPARGRSLNDLVREWGPALTGNASLADDRFPLLIKFLDAHQDLSVQVHPSPGEADRLGVPIKHESWYILHAEPDACIYLDVANGITPQAIADLLAAGKLVPCLRRVPVKQGDCFYLPSGVIHALGAGIVVAEIQTPSDVTYRLYDWDRTDADGNSRELHVDRALKSMVLHLPASQLVQPRRHLAGAFTTETRLVTCDNFIIDKVRHSEGFEKRLGYTEMAVWIVLEGTGQVTQPDGVTISFKAGHVVVIPAKLDQADLKILSDCVWLEVSIPL